jgi:co-chaperonin GroES (HSP10)
MTKIKPLADRVVLKTYSENKEVTTSGIYLPQNEKKEVSFIYEVIEI